MDRVEFYCSNYRMHDGIGRSYITVDGNEVYNMCTLKRDFCRQPKEGVYSQVEFMKAVDQYLNSPIETSIKSDNTLIKVLVLLDRRVGKRTLLNMNNTMPNEEDIVQYFYKLRCDAEGINQDHSSC
jgi:hypothetical protein